MRLLQVAALWVATSGLTSAAPLSSLFNLFKSKRDGASKCPDFVFWNDIVIGSFNGDPKAAETQSMNEDRQYVFNATIPLDDANIVNAYFTGPHAGLGAHELGITQFHYSLIMVDIHDAQGEAFMGGRMDR
ncbi:hypothetical protein P8C59_000560 [Phyllachora maydis]|uniref:Uncharacterized protein n=1 Tax=Phyllachora maydis TaxID=1825666 RepID=A0AAD9HXX7_9PEZI|nr:hypothetical protein P8C59_000560 [Phyllachora maydis]